MTNYILDFLVSQPGASSAMNATRLAWSPNAKRLPDSINARLVGTLPSVVQGNDGKTTCAFFVRASKDELLNSVSSGSVKCLVRPQFVKTPHGPLVVAYCMATRDDHSSQPFISETAIFPRLSSMRTHRELAELLQTRREVYLIVSDEKGECILNSKAGILNKWRTELAEKAREFDVGKQITDERTAIMSLYWYQERYSPSSKIFKVSH
jgi:hypothetical protein